MSSSSDDRFLPELLRSTPFSFLCGGAPSAGLLPHWTATETREKIDPQRTRYLRRWTDPHSGLSVEFEAMLYVAYAAADYVLWFTAGDGLSPPLESILPLDIPVRARLSDRVLLHSSRGGTSTAEDFQPRVEQIGAGSRTMLSAAGGRSSNRDMPWFNVQTESGGLLVAIGWSGQWRAEIARGESVRIRAGMEDGRFRLHPGERIRTPRILLAEWSGTDAFDGYNLGRRLLIEHYLPRTNGKLVFPSIAKPTPYDELDLATWRSSHGEDNQLRTIDEAKQVGVELYWLDAYWFEGGYPKGLGNWQLPVRKTVRETFPNGLRPLADRAHAAGMKFILWFAPETVYAGTWLDRNHPEWTIGLEGASEPLFRLADAEPRQWMAEFIGTALADFDVDICRLDSTFDPLPYWRAVDGPGREGISEIRYIEALYELWEQIVARGKRGLWIDNCAGGGRRIDLETCARSLHLWRSDFNDTPERRHDEIGAIADQAMIMGLNLLLPLHSGPVWRPEPYYWRSGLAAGMNIYWDLRPDRETGQYQYDRDLLKRAIREQKELRPFFLGDYYPLTPISADPAAWAAYEFVRPREKDGFAVFFRRPECPEAAMNFALRGIDASARYHVSWRWTYEAATSSELNGEELRGFRAEIPEKPGSLLVRFEPAAGRSRR